MASRRKRLGILEVRIAERDRISGILQVGFGLGFERTRAYVTRFANVRDAIPFPRTAGNERY